MSGRLANSGRFEARSCDDENSRKQSKTALKKEGMTLRHKHLIAYGLQFLTIIIIIVIIIIIIIIMVTMIVIVMMTMLP